MTLMTELVNALWSLKNDAEHAYKQALTGDTSPLWVVGQSYERVKTATMKLEQELCEDKGAVR